MVYATVILCNVCSHDVMLKKKLPHSLQWRSVPRPDPVASRYVGSHLLRKAFFFKTK